MPTDCVVEALSGPRKYICFLLNMPTHLTLLSCDSFSGPRINIFHGRPEIFVNGAPKMGNSLNVCILGAQLQTLKNCAILLSSNDCRKFNCDQDVDL